ncbi:protein obstructor-E-like [Topomyia yanbarensis]|uniref:protein obstructor-E-like n=1 Tax=Topomyia yanbarensis TaxID=2498891 RepID=UPI00273B1DB2|nr:protein obstructor-E-like [Topomyia yanbarensis]
MKLLVTFIVTLVIGVHATVQVDPECVGIRNGSTFRHEKDCSRYYSCRNGKFETHRCPYGLNWDQVRRVCLPLDMVSCKQGPFLPSTVPKPIWTTPPTIITTAIVPIEQNDEPVNAYKCPSFGVSSVPHQFSCSKYVMCFDGTPVVQNCAPGLHFDSQSQQCTFPIYAKCVLEAGICPTSNDKLVFIADKLDCAKYYYCYNGEPHENSCAEGLHWDPVNNWCTPKGQSHCTNYAPYKEIDEPFLTPKTVSCGNPSAHWVEHPRSCRHYYLCYNGKATLKRCDDGLLWDYKEGSCNYGTLSSCNKFN